MLGSEDTPFSHSAVITITGRRSDVSLPLLGSKGIGVFGNVSNFL